jgi:hypothetical protein
MAELMDENGRAKQHQHGGNYVNDIQNGHVKIRPLRRDALNISGKPSPAITERKEPPRAVFQGEKTLQQKKRALNP